MTNTPDQARGRFFLIAAMRFVGIAATIAGIGLIAKRWLEPAEIIGGLLILFGTFEALIVPAILARAWRTPPEA